MKLPVVLWILVTALAAAPAGAQFTSPGKASATLYSRVEAGQVRVAIQIRIEPGWHLYHEKLGNPEAIGKPTVVSLSGRGIDWGSIRFPEPLKLVQPGLGTWIYGHESTIVLYAAGRVAPGSTGADIGARIDGLTCQDNGSCVPYQQVVVTSSPGPNALFAAFPDDLTATARPDAATEVPVGPSAPGTPGGPIDPVAGDYRSVSFPDYVTRHEPARRSLAGWLVVAFVAGLILNVMPCVLPVISIKVLSFVQQAAAGRRHMFGLGLTFAAGILVVFLALGTAAVLGNLSWGEQFQSQAFLVVMIAIVFAFSLSMFGVYTLGVPAVIGAAAAGRTAGQGHGDAFFKGMLATVLATPCSGPFLGSTLTWTLAQPPAIVLAIFLALGLGMALPYVVLTANPALLKLVPRPGPWMETFKEAMGFVLLATVVYLMVSLHQQMLLFTCALLVFVGLACWAWGRFARFDQSRRRRLLVLGASALIAAGGTWVSFGPLRAMFAAGGTQHDWERFEPAAFAGYLDSGRSVFIDFTADWCPNCKFNEKWVYENRTVQQSFAVKGVVRFKADVTHASDYTDMLERLMAKLRARSIPFMALFPGDRPDAPHTRFDIVARGDLLKLLASLPDPPRTAAATLDAGQANRMAPVAVE